MFKYKTIYLENSLKGLKRAEKEKSKLENLGYTLIFESILSLIYEIEL